MKIFKPQPCSLDFEIGESQKDSYWMIGASLIPYGIL